MSTELLCEGCYSRFGWGIWQCRVVRERSCGDAPGPSLGLPDVLSSFLSDQLYVVNGHGLALANEFIIMKVIWARGLSIRKTSSTASNDYHTVRRSPRVLVSVPLSPIENVLENQPAVDYSTAPPTPLFSHQFPS